IVREQLDVLQYVDDLESACFFFFQAEDGIRDLTVTGVQTCALPIWGIEGSPTMAEEQSRAAEYLKQAVRLRQLGRDTRYPEVRRSEERRVGKECRSWWAPER